MCWLNGNNHSVLFIINLAGLFLTLENVVPVSDPELSLWMELWFLVRQ